MYFVLDSCNVNKVEVSEPALESNTSDGKTEVSTESEVYDIGQILSSQNASNLTVHQKYLILNKHLRLLNNQIKYPQKVYMGVTEVTNRITYQTILFIIKQKTRFTAFTAHYF